MHAMNNRDESQVIDIVPLTRVGLTKEIKLTLSVFNFHTIYIIFWYTLTSTILDLHQKLHAEENSSQMCIVYDAHVVQPKK